MKRIVLLLAVVIACQGCLSSKPVRKFPSHISGMFHHALSQSRMHILDCDPSLKLREYDLRASTVPGTRKFPTGWAWQVKVKGRVAWVHGLCWGERIKIACHPSGKGEERYETAHHECGHHHLLGVGVRGHPPKFDKHFKWSRATMSTASAEVWFLEGTDKDGTPWHIDFVTDGKVGIESEMEFDWESIKAILES